jgi:hypothetical protein
MFSNGILNRGIVLQKSLMHVEKGLILWDKEKFKKGLIIRDEGVPCRITVMLTIHDCSLVKHSSNNKNIFLQTHYMNQMIL